MPELLPARAADAPALAALAAASLPEPWSLAAWQAELRRRDTWVRVARDADGTFLGFVCARCTLEAAHVLALAVVSGARSRGVGAALLARLVRHAEEAGLRTVELETRADDARACAFYLRRGFAAVGRRPRYYGGRADAILLTRHLAPRPSVATAGVALS